MYKLVVVEDERDVRGRLVSLIKRCDSKFDLIAEYENGIDASDGILSDPPDLVITDIRIPYIDGIELSKKIRKRFPLVKIAIITGYSEFNFAKEAANLGVLGFISKPITQEDISALLEKVGAALDEEYNMASNMTNLEAFYERNLPIIREYDLSRLSAMSAVTPQFQKKLEHESINLNYRYLAMCVFDYDNAGDMERYELGFSSVRALIGEIFSDICGVEMFNRSEKLCLILKSDDKIDYAKIDSMMETILMRIGRFSGLSLSVGISNIYGNAPDFAGMFREAARALEYRSVMGGQKVLFFNNTAPVPASKLLFDSVDIKKLVYLLRYQSEEECLEYLSMVRRRLSSEEAKNSYCYMITSVLNTVIAACDDLDGLFVRCGGQTNIYRHLFDSVAAEEAFSYLADLVRVVLDLNQNVIIGNMEANLKKILTYMETHYRDADLGLESLARAVNFSVSYICALLKKSGNTSFTKYITALRMGKAKELLKDPSRKIVDIAQSLGYSDPFYFSHCFKKHTGVSPKEFRSHE